MDVDTTYIQELIDRPGESLTVEIKRWIDPDADEGIAKIARGAMALRNYNGGYLIIGFDDETLEPDLDNIPADVKAAFNIDKIQGIVAKYSSEPFEISVEFPEREGHIYPVIVVPQGIKSPVAAKSDLRDHEGNSLIRCDDVYVRSLNSNNTPSTTKATRNDWPKILDICFDNREADIGRFLRRHLGSLTPDIVNEIALGLKRGTESKKTAEDVLKEYLQECEERYHEEVKERDLSIPKHGYWEVGLILQGECQSFSADENFINLLNSSNPSYTGWPVWLDSRGFTQEDARPYVHNEQWEALMLFMTNGAINSLDFVSLDPKGKFFNRRSLQDDTTDNGGKFKSMTMFDFSLPIIRTAEALAVGLAFAKSMNCEPNNTELNFVFRWGGLKGRELASWVKPLRYISHGRKAHQDTVDSFIKINIDTPLSSLGEYNHRALKPLFAIFDGFSIGKDVVEELTTKLLERRL